MFQNYFSLFEGLHIEQSLLVLHGQLIKGSGLMKILNLQKPSTIRFSVVVDINSIKRATYCVHVTLSTLCKKLNEATALDKLNNPCPYDWLHQILGEKKCISFGKCCLISKLIISCLYDQKVKKISLII